MGRLLVRWPEPAPRLCGWSVAGASGAVLTLGGCFGGAARRQAPRVRLAASGAGAVRAGCFRRGLLGWGCSAALVQPGLVGSGFLCGGLLYGAVFGRSLFLGACCRRSFLVLALVRRSGSGAGSSACGCRFGWASSAGACSVRRCSRASGAARLRLPLPACGFGVLVREQPSAAVQVPGRPPPPGPVAVLRQALAAPAGCCFCFLAVFAFLACRPVPESSALAWCDASSPAALQRECAQRRGCHQQAERGPCQNPWLAFHPGILLYVWSRRRGNLRCAFWFRFERLRITIGRFAGPLRVNIVAGAA